MVFSSRGMLKRGVSRPRMLWHVLRRAFLLFLIGVSLNSRWCKSSWSSSGGFDAQSASEAIFRARTYTAVFEMRVGGGVGVGVGGGGGVNPPIPAQDPGICSFQGDPGWVP